MILSKNHNLGGYLIIKNQLIEQLQKFRYLGTIINYNWDPSLEIKCRVKEAKEASCKMSKISKLKISNITICILVQKSDC